MSETTPGRPSWLTEPCPWWCARDHHEDDHLEDRQHRSLGVELPAVVGQMDLTTMRRVGRGTELIVQRSQPVGESSSWIAVSDSETAERQLEVSAETAERLGKVLVREAADPSD